MPIMMSSMPCGETSNVVAHAIRPLEAPENARIWLKVAEPKMMRKAMTVTRRAASTERRKLVQVSAP